LQDHETIALWDAHRRSRRSSSICTRTAASTFCTSSTVGAVTFRHHAGFTLVYDDNFPNKEEDRSGARGTVEEMLWT
jgi:adenine deaminase